MYRWIELPKMRATVKRGKDRVAKILGKVIDNSWVFYS